MDCYINGFADNGLYASPENGSIFVEGGVFANCAVASFRVGDNSVIHGAYVLCDSAPDGFKNMRGIRLRQGNNVLVDDCTIDMFSVNNSDGALVLAHRLEAATIRNVRIRVNPDGIPAIRIRGPHPGVPRDGPIRISDVSITGEAAKGVAVEVNDRDNCQFDYAYVRQTGSNRDGFLFDECQDVLVKNTVIDVTRTPIVSREGTTIEKVDVRTSGNRWSGFDLFD